MDLDPILMLPFEKFKKKNPMKKIVVYNLFKQIHKLLL